MYADEIVERSPQDTKKKLRVADKKMSGRFTFIKSQQESQQSQIQDNRNRIKLQLRGQLNAIITKPQQPIYQKEDQLVELGKKLDIPIDANDVHNIIPNTKEFFEEYELHERLGEGCLGLVRRVVQKSSGNEYAVKIIATQDDEIIRNMIIEFKRLVTISHQNIVKAYKLFLGFDNGFQSESEAYMVMELIKGKEMFEVINETGHYSEDNAKELFKQLLNAIQYMHKNGICHRDLKPNNILCVQDKNQIKVTDFNVSKFSDSYKEFGNLNESDKIEMWTYTGTVAFSAPEIFTGEGYNQMVDMWSAGCILYSMLSGQLPFNSNYLNDLIEQIKEAKFEFPEQIFQDVSDEAKNLISELLQKDSTLRLHPDDALNHPWFEHQVFIRKSLKHLTINQNLCHLTSKHCNRSRQRTILLKSGYWTGSSDEEVPDISNIKNTSNKKSAFYQQNKSTKLSRNQMLRKSHTTINEDN